ncbi:MAG: AIR synthase-related protein, partial [Aeromicrobium sp.]|uniref:AIR synthase-related protein n=1 Tax=Aeromicrobium sp. TaxID=1871063 RepID=UPI003C552294
IHQHLGGLPPRVDLEAERALAELMLEAAAAGVLESAHDLSDGGLGMALAEASFRHGIGAAVVLEDPFIELFSESSARAMVVVSPHRHEELVDLAQKHGVPLASVGRTGGSTLEVGDEFSVDVAELRTAWQATLPDALA